MESLVHILLSNALTAAVMTVIVLGAGRICRRPALTHSLWLVVMLKLVTPPLVPVSLPAVNIFAAIGSSPAVAHVDHGASVAAPFKSLVEFDAYEHTARPSDDLSAGAQSGLAKTESDFSGTAVNTQSSDVPRKGTQTASGLSSGWRWEPPVLFVVLAGALAWWTIAAVRIIQFQRLLKDVQRAPDEWQSHTNDLAEWMGLGWCPSICLVPGRVPPMLWAIGGRPRLLVPSKLWTEMGVDERTSLLLHELAHLKRRDHWVRWLELVVVGLYWWHPVVWWARRALREVEEQCCDAWVVWAMPDRARTYAAALLAAVEFVSGARPVPAAASATSGSGHVSCLKRRLRMIVRAKTPKGLSWAGRIAVLGAAALLLPLAPSWAQKSETKQATKERREFLRERAKAVGLNDRDTLALKQQLATEHLAAIRRNLLEVQSQKRKAQTRLDVQQQPEPEGKQELAMLDDLEKRLTEEIESIGKENQSLAVNVRALKEIQDGDKDDDDKDDKARDVAERFQKQLQDLITKLGKELSPVTEEVRKALERAVGEVHRSLEKDGLSAEGFGKALEKSQEELRKAFEGGSAVDKELREAIDRARKDMQDAFDRTKGDVEDQVESLRQQSRTLRDQARENFDRARGEAERRIGPDVEGQPNRDELESARREIRDLQQQLQRATRRLDQLQQRESRRNPVRRREPNPQPESQPQNRATPRAEPTAPETPQAPAVPATPSRPARPNVRRPLAPNRPGPGIGRRGPQIENDGRIRELEEKMNRLLKELETLKEEKSPKESK